MPRVTNAPASRKRRNRRLNLAKGFMGARARLLKKATESVDRAMQLATIDRRRKKRDYRALWIARISAACRLNGITYSRFAEGLRKARINLNRKMLAEIAIHDPDGFTAIVAQAKAGDS